MLSNAFSFVPVQLVDPLQPKSRIWKLIPVFGIALLLRKVSDEKDTNGLLAMSIADAIKEDKGLAIDCEFCKLECLVRNIADTIAEEPMLVTTNGISTGSLRGIVTSLICSPTRPLSTILTGRRRQPRMAKRNECARATCESSDRSKQTLLSDGRACPNQKVTLLPNISFTSLKRWSSAISWGRRTPTARRNEHARLP